MAPRRPHAPKAGTTGGPAVADFGETSATTGAFGYGTTQNKATLDNE
jgi:hypothetical protein